MGAAPVLKMAVGLESRAALEDRIPDCEDAFASVEGAREPWRRPAFNAHRKEAGALEHLTLTLGARLDVWGDEAAARAQAKAGQAAIRGSFWGMEV